jgi:hypothetical protein
MWSRLTSNDDGGRRTVCLKSSLRLRNAALTRLRRLLRILLASTIVSLASTISLIPPAWAQTCTEASMRSLINDLQTGNVKWAFLSPMLANAIMAQTGGTGRYAQLAQLGPPVSVQVIGGRPLQYGGVCVFRTQFPAATLDWQTATGFGLVQAVSFQYSGPGSTTPTGGPPPPVPQGGGGGSSTPPKTVGSVPSTTEACQLYPNLC